MIASSRSKLNKFLKNDEISSVNVCVNAFLVLFNNRVAIEFTNEVGSFLNNNSMSFNDSIPVCSSIVVQKSDLNGLCRSCLCLLPSHLAGSSIFADNLELPLPNNK